MAALDGATDVSWDLLTTASCDDGCGEGSLGLHDGRKIEGDLAGFADRGDWAEGKGQETRQRQSLGGPRRQGQGQRQQQRSRWRWLEPRR